MISYLDYNSTTPLHALAKQEIVKSLDIIGNPSSSHKLGLQARMVVDTARYTIAKVFGLRQEQVVFTSGGSESNNMILKSFKNILSTPLEHPSVLEVLESKNILKLTENYEIDLADLEQKLKTNEYDLVSIAYVNSETGIIQNVKQVAEVCKQYNCLIHTDATQAWGKIDVDFNYLGVNLMTLSPHKIGLAKGVGVILTDGKADLKTLINGGGQERGRRSGTENVQALASLAVTQEVLDDNNSSQKRELIQYLEQEVLNICDQAIIVAKKANRVSNTSYIITPNVDSQTQVINADMANVCISAGSACSSGKVKSSTVIKNLGFNEDLASCGIRISIGKETTKQDIDKFLEAYKSLINR